MPLASGERIGAYEIQHLLGVGGMGEVYRARDATLNREVAIKILPEAFALDGERLARFKREAQILASLNHPNIAAIYGFDDSRGLHALVLELVDGLTLAERISEGAIPLDEALPIGRQIAEALEAAHEQGIIHRDLKPANVKVRQDGRVKVLDFGLAKLAQAPGSGLQASELTQSPTITSPAMTAAGLILGTAAYMSPEQAKGRPADARSDVWSFGAVLFEMLTGKRVFEGDDVSDTLAAVLRAEPDWNALPADVPEHLRLLLRRCLEKDRSKRVSDMSIARFLIGEPFHASSTQGGRQIVRKRPVWQRALPAVLAAVAAAALTAVGLRITRPSATSPTVTRFTYNLPSDTRYSTGGRQMLAISPDGTRFAYVANARLFVRSMNEPESTALRGTEASGQGNAGLTTPVFSPDGRDIAYWSSGELKKIASRGGTATTICPLDFSPYGMSWDGYDILIGGGPRGVLRVRASGGSPEVLIPVKQGELAQGPQRLPGGALLFSLAHVEQPRDAATIVAQQPNSAQLKTIVEGAADPRYLESGTLVYAIAGVLYAVDFDARSLELVGEARPAVEGIARALGSNSGAAQYSVSRTGTLMYVPGPANVSVGTDLGIFDGKGSVDPLSLPPQNYESPRFSPRNDRLAVSTDDGKTANVLIYDLSGKSAIRQLTLEGRNRYPIWSPNGTYVAFQSDRQGDRAIFRQRADGTGAAERLTTAAPDESHVPDAWFPQDDRLLLSVQTKTSVVLRAFGLQDRKMTEVTAERFPTLPHASLSPDGHWIVYEDGRAGVLYAQPFPPTGNKFRLGPGYNSVWAPDGHSIYTMMPGATAFSILGVTTTNGFDISKQVGSLPRPASFGAGPTVPRPYDVAPDGKRFVSVIPRYTSGSLVRPQINFVVNWFEELLHPRS